MIEHEEPLAAVEVAELSPQRRRDRRGEQVGGDHPGQMRRSAEVPGDGRQRRRDDGLVQRREEHAQKQGAQDEPEPPRRQHRGAPFRLLPSRPWALRSGRSHAPAHPTRGGVCTQRPLVSPDTSFPAPRQHGGGGRIHPREKRGASTGHATRESSESRAGAEPSSARLSDPGHSRDAAWPAAVSGAARCLTVDLLEHPRDQGSQHVTVRNRIAAAGSGRCNPGMHASAPSAP
jgi:hypothetical protein